MSRQVLGKPEVIYATDTCINRLLTVEKSSERITVIDFLQTFNSMIRVGV